MVARTNLQEVPRTPGQQGFLGFETLKSRLKFNREKAHEKRKKRRKGKNPFKEIK